MTPLQAVRANQRAYAALRGQAARRTAALWKARGGLTEQDLQSWLAVVIPLAAGIRRTTAALTVGYLTRLLREMGADAAQPALPVDLTGRRVGDQDLYTRPVVTVRVATSAGKVFEEAMEMGRQRALAIVSADVMLTQRTATVSTLKQSAVTGYRRVLTGESCDLCREAAKRVYKTDSLAPLHDNCDCGYAPVMGSDPAQSINKRFSTDTDTPVSVRTHGELGPVLVVADHHFQGPSDID